ncbi:flavin reductase [Colwellia sp. UCD-KL20]|uniref:flavin reductase family protein n=1 Tax=Colwellia sp. UCD-KL20 TaxID=1917165 RepID=UPI001177C022|nr:flavin reductase [Colwellia sp. UCD-KL20]
MPQSYRAKFINSLSGFKSANLIGTQSLHGQSNLAIFSSVIHLGASPALVGFIMRPDNAKRHTLNNIISTEQYTINQVSKEFYRKAHQTSARYSQEESEFVQSGLSAHYIDGVYAPFVKESRLKYALKLQDIIHIKRNNTQLIIGEISHLLCENKAIQEDGYIDIESLGTTCISGLDSYHNTTRIKRLSYAKPNRPINDLHINGTSIYSLKDGLPK